MGTVSLTDPVGHTLADAGIIATNNSNLRAVINGGIDAANLSAGAVTAAKLATTGTPDGTKFLRDDMSWQPIAGGSAFLPGMMMEYAGSAAPTGWLICDGSAISRATYATLFALVGTTYGVGDGSTTFNIPDMRGRMPVGVGTHADINALAKNEGVATVANRRPKHQTSKADPGHTHSHFVDAGGTSGAAFASGDGSTHNGTASMNSNTTGITVGTNNANDAVDSSPYLALNYIIKT